MTARAVFLDRDGVINRALVLSGRPYPPSGPSELKILPGVHDAIGRLRGAGFRLIVVTNQPDVARGTQTREAVEALHTKLKTELALDEFCVCYHDDADRCQCRKPSPGLLLGAALNTGVDLRASYLVGDRWRDIEAGRRAGCATIFIDHGYAERRPSGFDAKVTSLLEASEWILRTIKESR